MVNSWAIVYKTVKKIPAGKVTTYGAVAGKLKITPNMVGWALHANKSSEVPCHRVVNLEGRLAANFAFDGWREQKRRLFAEGVKFKDKMHVDLEGAIWV